MALNISFSSDKSTPETKDHGAWYQQIPFMCLCCNDDEYYSNPATQHQEMAIPQAPYTGQYRPSAGYGAQGYKSPAQYGASYSHSQQQNSWNNRSVNQYPAQPQYNTHSAASQYNARSAASQYNARSATSQYNPHSAASQYNPRPAASQYSARDPYSNTAQHQYQDHCSPIQDVRRHKPQFGQVRPEQLMSPSRAVFDTASPKAASWGTASLKAPQVNSRSVSPLRSDEGSSISDLRGYTVSPMLQRRSRATTGDRGAADNAKRRYQGY
ncbi:hypothetical protein GGR54DRAFT_275751 [Hypoxylon sp. NC1633]|nr:hypothetical protein GGR54DRAFT_275751 [Hypoxylon sp. NC1633]